MNLDHRRRPRSQTQGAAELEVLGGELETALERTRRQRELVGLRASVHRAKMS